MGMILAFIKKPITIILLIISLLVIGAGGYWYWSVNSELDEMKKANTSLTSDNQKLKNNNAVLQTTLDDNKAELDKLKALYAEQEKIQRDLNAKNEGTRVSLGKIQTKITNAPESGNGAIAPVLRDTIDDIQARRDNKKGEKK